jgi:hypothetical protein
VGSVLIAARLRELIEAYRVRARTAPTEEERRTWRRIVGELRDLLDQGEWTDE